MLEPSSSSSALPLVKRAADITPPTATSADSVRKSAKPEELVDLEQGASIGRYVILEAVGAGGMGVVYAAYDKTLKRKVALKVLRPDLCGAARSKERLLREAQAMAKVSHPHVLQVFEAGIFEDRVYLALEFVAGTTMSEWLRSPRSRSEILDVIEQAGMGLAASHRTGIVHRDFKPSNIMIGEDGRVRVSDFGLARGARSGDPTADADADDEDADGEDADGEDADGPRKRPPLRFDEQNLTRTGFMAGTPAYMAPEQFLGQKGDAHSDQYSFCLVLFESIFGRRLPVQRIVSQLRTATMDHAIHLAEDLDQTTRTVQAAVTSGPPSAETYRSGDNFVRKSIVQPAKQQQVPRWLRRIVLRGLSTVPEDRFPSMDELLEALRRGPVKRRRIVLIAVGAIALALLVLFSSLFLRDEPEDTSMRCARQATARIAETWNDDTRAAVESALLATGRSYAGATVQGIARAVDRYAERWMAEYVDTCRAPRSDRQSAEFSAMRMTCLERHRQSLGALSRVLTQIDADTVHQAFETTQSLGDVGECRDLRALMSRQQPLESEAAREELLAIQAELAEVRVLERLGSYEAAGARIAELLARADRLAYRPVQAELLLEQGRIAADTGKLRESEKSLRLAIAVAEESGDDMYKTHGFIELVELVGLRLTRIDEGRLWAELSRSALARVGAPAALSASLDNNIGSLDYRSGRFPESLEGHRRALEKWQAIVDADDPRVSETHDRIAATSLALGELDQARHHFDQALESRKRVLGAEHPHLADSLSNVGTVLLALDAPEQAQEYFQQAYDRRVESKVEDNPGMALLLTNLGNTWLALEELEKALEYHERALALEQKVYGENHMDVATSLNNLGVLLAAAERFDEAGQRYRRALAISTDILRADHPLIAEILVNHGDLHLLLGEPARALEAFQRALRILGQNPTMKLEQARARFGLARAHRDGGDESRARSMVAEARAVLRELGTPGEPLAQEIAVWLEEDEI